MGAQRDILGLLAENPYQIGPGVTLGTLWDPIQEKQLRSIPEARIPWKTCDFEPPRLPPLPLGGGDHESAAADSQRILSNKSTNFLAKHYKIYRSHSET